MLDSQKTAHNGRAMGWHFVNICEKIDRIITAPHWVSHDDVNQMETFSALLAICAGNSPATGEFPTQKPVTRSFDVFFDLRLA